MQKCDIKVRESRNFQEAIVKCGEWFIPMLGWLEESHGRWRWQSHAKYHHMLEKTGSSGRSITLIRGTCDAKEAAGHAVVESP